MEDLILDNPQQARELAYSLSVFGNKLKKDARRARDAIKDTIVGEYEMENMPVPQGDELRQLLERDMQPYLPVGSGLSLDNIDYDDKPEDFIREDGMGISMEDPYVRSLFNGFTKSLENANQ